MLVLGRREQEEILIGNNIIIKIIKITGSQVQLGIICPKEINICRKEIQKKYNENKNTIK